MEKLLKENMALFRDATHIIPIHKGFSSDKKYIVDNRYLIRLFPTEDEEKRRAEFRTLRRLKGYSKYIPEAIVFGSLPSRMFSYMVLTYLPGEDGEVALEKLTEKEQYEAGIQAGMELKHQLTSYIHMNEQLMKDRPNTFQGIENVLNRRYKRS